MTAAKSGTKAILVTGSNGLIGSEVCLYFAARGFEVSGIDNNQRAAYFGPQGDTRWNKAAFRKRSAISTIAKWMCGTGLASNRQ